MIKLKWAFDLDGTCVDFISTFKRLLKDQFNLDFPTNYHRHCYKLEDLFTEIPKHEIFKLIIDTIKDVDSLQVYPNVKEFFYNTYIGNPFFITARNQHDVYESTIKFISEKMINRSFNIIFDTLKGQVMKKHNIDIIVEDHLEVSKSIAEMGKLVLLVDQPWNRTNDEIHPNITRINDFYEVEEIYLNPGRIYG